MKEEHFYLNLKKSVAVLVFISVIFFKVKLLLAAYLAAILHEAAHMASAWYFGFLPKGFELSVFGIRLFTSVIKNTKQKLIIYLSGPMLSIFLYFTGGFFLSKGELCLFFTYANLYMGIINLVPVFPLDGAIVLKTLTSSCMGIIRSLRFCRFVSMGSVFVLTGAEFLLILNGEVNISLIMIIIFLLCGQKAENIQAISDKKAVLSGNIKSKNKIRYLACDSKSELLSLAGYISFDYQLLAASFKGEKFFAEICQTEITDGIKKYGALCTVEEYIEKTRRII